MSLYNFFIFSSTHLKKPIKKLEYLHRGDGILNILTYLNLPISMANNCDKIPVSESSYFIDLFIRVVAVVQS